MKKYAILLLCTLALFLTCGNEREPTGAGDITEHQNTMEQLNIDLYYYLWNPNDDNTAYQTLTAELLENYGININPVQVPWIIPNPPDKPLHVLMNLEELLADTEGNYDPNPLRNQPYPDLIRTEPGFYYTDLKKDGILQPMDGYLKENAPSLYHDLTLIQDSEKDTIFEIPVQSGRYPSCWIIRDDIRNELGVPEIHDIDSLITFLKTARLDPEYDAYDILSFRAGPVGEELAAFALGWRHTHAFPDNYLLYYRENNGTVYSLLEEMDVEAEKVISSSAGLRFTKALEIEDYVKKWIACYLPASYANQPINKTNQELIQYGFYYNNALTGAALLTRGKNITVAFLPENLGKPSVVNTGADWYLALPAVNRNPEETVTALHEIYSAGLKNTFYYGIEGEHWKEENGSIEILDAGYVLQRKLQRNPLLFFPVQGEGPPLSVIPENKRKYFDFASGNTAAERDILSDFTFITSRPISENKQNLYPGSSPMNAYESFMSGGAGYQEMRTAFSGRAGESLDMIQKELQSQIDQYLK